MHSRHYHAFALLFILLSSYALAHEGGGGHFSEDDVFVRAIQNNPATLAYTFECFIPEGASENRYWTVRNANGLLYEAQIPNATITHVLGEQELYHVGCEVANSTTAPISYIQSDFHIDLRTGESSTRPNINVQSTNELNFTAGCTHPTSTDIDLHWYLFHPATGTNLELLPFQNQQNISYNVSEPGLWDLGCGIWDNTASTWTQDGLPIEFFHDGPAYIPSADGCMPYGLCPAIVNGSNESNQPPNAPTWLEPGLNRTEVDVFDFHIQVWPMFDPDGDEHVASDFELWDVALNERVWASEYTNILTHIHNADGTFENSLAGQDRLVHETWYQLRARFFTNSTTNNVSQWSEWRVFRTAPPVNLSGSPFTWTAREGFTVELVAANISVPVNIEMAPPLYGHLPENEQPLLYVTQLYGQVGVVLKDGTYRTYANNLLNYETFGSLPGSGETGVSGIYVDPTSGDLWVSMVYNDPVSGFLGKVDHFTTNASGTGYTSVTTIIQDIPVSPSHQVHTITRGPDGKLYLHVGDDDQPFNAQNLNILSGKILRMNDDGSIPADNPFGPSNYVYAAGFRNPFGGAWRPGTNELYVTSNGPDSHDAIFNVSAGDTFGWCCDPGLGAWFVWLLTVAPTQLRFYDGNGVFPADHNDTMFIALSGPTYSLGPSLRGKKITQFRIEHDGSNPQVEDLVTYTGNGYGAPIGLAFGDDGLYFTDIYGEAGFVGVGLTKGNIFKIVPGNQTLVNETNETSLTAGLGTAPWYPQGLNVVWDCKGDGGSGSYSYDYFFGDGNKQVNVTEDTVWHTYAFDGTFNASCTVHDLVTGETDDVTSLLVLGTTAPPSDPPLLTVIKKIVNDGNGTLTIPEVTLSVGNVSVISGIPYEFAPGTYVVSESFHEGYSAIFTGDCSANGTITLATNDVKTCTITNNDPGSNGGCFDSVALMPASCSGDITSDSFEGSCRTIECTDGGTPLKVLACDKPGFFEMYNQGGPGGIELCLGDACISDNGFAKSSSFPVCVGPPPVCTDDDDDGYALEDGACGPLDCDDSDPSIHSEAEEICNGVDDNCNLLVDEGGVCSVCGNGLLEEGEECDDDNTASGDGCSSTCTIEGPESVTVSVAPSFPQGLNVVLVCTPEEFTPASYGWDFGDGVTQPNIPNSNVWHTYTSPGEYTVSCTGRAGVVSATDTMTVTIV